MEPIARFSGRYRAFSNFYPSVVELDGQWYRTVEHAYQAAKFPYGLDRDVFFDEDLTPGQAKRLGRGKGGKEWHSKSLEIMLNLLRQKFREPKLRSLLLSTVGIELIEGNDWNDKFFGVVNGVGENWLGKLLMAVRDELTGEEL